MKARAAIAWELQKPLVIEEIEVEGPEEGEVLLQVVATGVCHTDAFTLSGDELTGHSMGGHGALICALKEPGRYRLVSAFAPICHPMASSWGQVCFKANLGDDREAWAVYDTTRLIEAGAEAIPLLIDQGTADEFLAQQLHPASLERVCAARHFPLTLRMQDDYDHSYHFIATFIGEHLAWHAQALRAA